MRERLARGVVAFGLLLLASCASQDGYREAFDERQLLERNVRQVAVEPERARQALVATLVRDGFTIQEALPDVVTAVRTMQDRRDDDISYSISVSAAITALGGERSSVAFSANQRTTEHRKKNAVVRSESTIHDAAFYETFFKRLDRAIAQLPPKPVPAAPTPVTAPAPLSPQLPTGPDPAALAPVALPVTEPETAPGAVPAVVQRAVGAAVDTAVEVVTEAAVQAQQRPAERDGSLLGAAASAGKALVGAGAELAPAAAKVVAGQAAATAAVGVGAAQAIGAGAAALAPLGTAAPAAALPALPELPAVGESAAGAPGAKDLPPRAEDALTSRPVDPQEGGPPRAGGGPASVAEPLNPPGRGLIPGEESLPTRPTDPSRPVVEVVVDKPELGEAATTAAGSAVAGQAVDKLKERLPETLLPGGGVNAGAEAELKAKLAQEPPLPAAPHRGGLTPEP